MSFCKVNEEFFNNLTKGFVEQFKFTDIPYHADNFGENHQLINKNFFSHAKKSEIIEVIVYFYQYFNFVRRYKHKGMIY